MASFWLRNRKSALIVTLSAGIVFGATTGLFLALTHDLPQIQSLEGYRPAATTHILSSDGVLLTELFSEKRTPIHFSEIPKALIDAVIATEDRHFYKHSGVDLRGILRAVLKDVLAGEYVEGASTITQQLSKTLFLSSRKSLARKIKEAFLAIQIERKYTKNEILALYLNQVYFGSGAYGVSAAAQTFFGKPLARLTLAECALIAATLKAPSRFSPLVNKDLARQRRNMVLKQMNETGMISEEAFEAAWEEKVVIPQHSEPKSQAPSFVEYVKGMLEESVGSESLYAGGLSVRTSLSFELQTIAEEAVEKGLAALSGRMRRHRIADPKPECALIALELSTGGILAMIGGKEVSQKTPNRAVSAAHPPGSAFRPIIYAAALEKGYAQNTLIPEGSSKLSISSQTQTETGYSPSPGSVTLREAFSRSKHYPSIRLLERVGPETVIPFAHRLGIGSRLEPDPSLALGTSAVTLIDLTAAYAVFPGFGCKISPQGVREVIGPDGQVWQAGPGKEIVMSAANAAVMTDLLQSAIMTETGIGKTFPAIKPFIGGKAGTTDLFRDALFIGFSPTIAVGVWVGLDTGDSLGSGETGVRAAFPIWLHFMEKALSKTPPAPFSLPGDVLFLRMDPISGRLLPAEDESGVDALFRKGVPLAE